MRDNRRNRLGKWDNEAGGMDILPSAAEIKTHYAAHLDGNCCDELSRAVVESTLPSTVFVLHVILGSRMQDIIDGAALLGVSVSGAEVQPLIRLHLGT